MRKHVMMFMLALIPVMLFGQEEDKYQISISGFISSETIFDTRQTVSARAGDVLLFPAPVSEDTNGDDINAIPNFNMFAIHSRLRTHVKGPDMFGAKTSALVETDFVGNADPLFSMMRLRHAILKMEWENSSLLAGHYWHPMFVTSTYPEVAGWGGGIPFAVLSRNPQVRFNLDVTENFSASLIALTQSVFNSPGPKGASSEYVRNSGMPEWDMHVEYNNNGFIAGAVAGYKQLMPRTTTSQGNKADQTLGSLHANAYLQVAKGPFTAKVKGLYGQNMTNFLMMGGYADITKSDGSMSYTNVLASSYWGEVIYRSGLLSYSLFGGYTQNLGLEDQPGNTSSVAYYSRGANINDALRIAPRITVHKEKFLIMGEVSYNTAAYGNIAEDGTVENTNPATNTRFHLHLKYNF